jgi:hypothetical protein
MNSMIWAMLCLSQAIYILVGFHKPPSPSPQDVSSTMFPPLLLVAGGLAAGTVWWRRRALVRPIERGDLDPGTPEGQARAFPAFLINLVLSESVAIYGLVLTFLSDDVRYVVGFVGAGLTLMFIHRPFAPELQTRDRIPTTTSRPPPIA